MMKINSRHYNIYHKCRNCEFKCTNNLIIIIVYCTLSRTYEKNGKNEERDDANNV